MKNAILPTPAGIVRSALTAVALVALAGGSVSANAQTLQFVAGEPGVTSNFNSLGVNSPISTIGWTNSTGTNRGVVPGGAGEYTAGGVVVTNSSDTRDNLRSPAFALPTELSSASVVYASGYIYHSASSGAGARVLMETPDLLYTGGLAITDGNNNQTFGIWGGTGTSWTYSAEKARANHWYEIALVIALDHADISQSKGYLFVRDVTEGDTEFRLVDGLGGVDMGYTNARNFYTATKWRVEGFRSNEQIGQLSIGAGTLQPIPEPGTVSLLLVSGLAVGGLRLRHWKNSVR